MSMSLKSVNTADLESASSSDLESLNAMNPPQPELEDAEMSVRNAQRVLEDAKAERPEIVLATLINVRSIIQKEIDSLVGQRDSGSHKKDEAEVPKVSTSSHNVPRVTESTSALEEEEVLSHAPSQSDGSEESGSNDESSSYTDEYADMEPAYRGEDGIHLCLRIDCGWEVAFGYCHGCLTKYTMKDDEGDLRTVDPRNPLTVFRKGILARSNSPPPEPIPSHTLPLGYTPSEELISRGATPAFCERWQATFDEDNGIIIRVNDCSGIAYETLIQEYGYWEVWVGRRIKLYGDECGSEFVDELLDVIFTEDDDGRWITYKDPGGYFVTRPKEGPNIPEGAEVVEIADEYDPWSDGEEDREPSVGSDSDTPWCEAESTSNPATSDCESTWWSDDSENEAEPEEDEIEEA